MSFLAHIVRVSGLSGGFRRGKDTPLRRRMPPPSHLLGTGEAYEEIVLAPPRRLRIGDEIQSALDLFEVLCALREVGFVLRNRRVMYPGPLRDLPQREAVEGTLAGQLVNCVEDSAVSV